MIGAQDGAGRACNPGTGRRASTLTLRCARPDRHERARPSDDRTARVNAAVQRSAARVDIVRMTAAQRPIP
ncbi:hypothetical protein EMIT0111MI5_70301 [Burkholderia sp. IT-111MI5]